MEQDWQSVGLPWWSSPVAKTPRSQGAQVQSPVREQRSHKQSMAKGKERQKRKMLPCHKQRMLRPSIHQPLQQQIDAETVTDFLGLQYHWGW